MTFGARAHQVVAIAIAALLYGEVTGRREFAVFAALLAVASLLRRPKGISTPTQALLLIASGLIAFVMNGVFPDVRGVADRSLADSYAVLSGGALLLAAFRTHIDHPEWGSLGTLGMGLLVFLGCGSVQSGSLYLPLLVAYVCVALTALGSSDSARAAWWGFARRDWCALGVVVIVASVGTSGFLVGIPHLYERTNAWLIEFVGGRVRTGFDEGPIALGSMEGLFQSDSVVMRVAGPMSEPLRGRVYTRYANGFWMPEKVAGERRIGSYPERASASPAESTEIRYATDVYEIFFLPRNATRVALDPPDATVDEFGVVRSAHRDSPERIQLEIGPNSQFAASQPSAPDLQLPADAEAELRRVATDWTRHAQSPLERLNVIEARLETDYTYALVFERPEPGKRSLDPVLDFLLREPRGHCEYFASAMALLARATGIPARVVTGYRVSERSPWSDYFVVRERHAHAWVEAHVDGEWRTFDPSPIRSAEESEPQVMSAIPALLDWVVFAWQRDGRTALLVALIAFFIGLQIRNLLRGKQPRRARDPLEATVPPDYIEKLLARLRAGGNEYRRGESIETFAERIAAGRGEANEPRSLLLRYAALRYGGLGDPVGLESDVLGWLRAARPGT